MYRFEIHASDPSLINKLMDVVMRLAEALLDEGYSTSSWIIITAVTLLLIFQTSEIILIFF